MAAEGDEYWGGELYVIFSTRILVILLQFGVKTAIKYLNNEIVENY